MPLVELRQVAVVDVRRALGADHEVHVPNVEAGDPDAREAALLFIADGREVFGVVREALDGRDDEVASVELARGDEDVRGAAPEKG